MEELLELAEEAADSACCIHLRYIDKTWFAELGDDLCDMDAMQLHAYLEELEYALSVLDEQEPKSVSSPKYDTWADVHECLEDVLDECRERLDELED